MPKTNWAPRSGHYVLCKSELNESKSNGDLIVGRVVSVRANGRVECINLITGRPSLKTTANLLSRNYRGSKNEADHVLGIYTRQPTRKGKHSARLASAAIWKQRSAVPSAVATNRMSTQAEIDAANFGMPEHTPAHELVLCDGFMVIFDLSRPTPNKLLSLSPAALRLKLLEKVTDYLNVSPGQSQSVQLKVDWPTVVAGKYALAAVFSRIHGRSIIDELEIALLESGIEGLCRVKDYWCTCGSYTLLPSGALTSGIATG